MGAVEGKASPLTCPLPGGESEGTRDSGEGEGDYPAIFSASTAAGRW
jgi:hypothetical protein